MIKKKIMFEEEINLINNVFLAALIGFIAGIVASFFGIGGGVIFVPSLIIIFGFEPAAAVATSLLAIIFTSLSSVTAYTRKKLVKHKEGLFFVLASIPGALLGAYLTSILPGRTIRIIFSFFLFFTAYNIAKNEGKESLKHHKRVEGANKKLAVIAFFTAGIASGLLGIGGGILFVPAMVILIGFDIHEAIATSAFIILITTTFGVLEHLILGHVNFLFGVLFGLFGVLGAQIGAIISIRTQSRTLRILFAFLLVVSGLRLLIM